MKGWTALAVSCFSIVGVLSLDIGFFAMWERLRVSMGPLLGLELGVLFFLNFSGTLLAIESLESWFRLPGMGWFYRLPVSVGEYRETPRRKRISRSLLSRSSKLVLLTAFFYILETFLFPFSAATRFLPCEALMVGVAFLWLKR